MKNYLIILMLLISKMLVAQSISASKILSVLENQNFIKVKSELTELGFKSMGDETDYNINILSFQKSDRLGREHIEIGKNSELFMFVYKPVSKAYFNSLKEKMLTSDFKYSYTHKNAKYYETSVMRLGINESASIISFFVPLKN